MSRGPSLRWVALGAMLALGSGICDGSVLFVDDDAPSGGDGTNWGTAYRHLQDALAAAAGSYINEIRVGQGIYRPDRSEANPAGTGDRAATFQLVDGVALLGGYLGLSAGEGESPHARDVEKWVTTLSGDLAGDDGSGSPGRGENSYHVVTMLDVDASTLLEGFTITGGHADGSLGDDAGGGLLGDHGSAVIRRCTFTGNEATFLGGAAYLEFGAPTFQMCVVRENTGWNTGGVYTFESDLVVVECSFEENVSANGFAHLWKSRGAGLLEGCLFRAGVSRPSEAGVFLERGSATVSECIFQDNIERALECGSLFCTIADCQFIGNYATDQAGAIWVGGFYSATHVHAWRCRFEGNHSTQAGGAIWVDDALWAYDCDFVNNTAGGIDSPSAVGGAIFSYESSIRLYGCRFIGNQALYGRSAQGKGGAIFVWGPSTYRFTSCLFNGNVSALGGAVYQRHNTYGTNVSYFDCTFAHNAAAAGTGGVYCEAGSQVAMSNCILWNNGGDSQSDQVLVQGSPPLVTYSCLQGLARELGPGNIAADPQFVDPLGPDATAGTEDDDLHVAPTSPCIDAGNSLAVPLDLDDHDQDGNTSERVPFDLDRLPRFSGDGNPIDRGCGGPVVVDMGTYELQVDPVNEVLPADLTYDGTVGVQDLVELIVAWGPCPGDCCPGDLDGDAMVGAGDLVVLLLSWSL